MNYSRLFLASLLVCAMVVSAQAALVVHLPLDGNLNDIAGGHTVTLTDGFYGDSSYVPGKIGSALRFTNPQGSTSSGSSFEIDCGIGAIDGIVYILFHAVKITFLALIARRLKSTKLNQLNFSDKMTFHKRAS